MWSHSLLVCCGDFSRNCYVVAFITGVLAGILAYHYINKHQLQTTKPESSSHQQKQPAGPVYEEVFVTSAKEKIELKANVAYGPVQH